MGKWNQQVSKVIKKFLRGKRQESVDIIVFSRNNEQRRYLLILKEIIKSSAYRVFHIRRLNPSPELVSDKIYLTARHSNPGQSAIDFFHGTPFQNDYSSWFTPNSKHSSFKMGFLNMSRGFGIFHSKGLFKIFQNVIAYDVDLETTTGGPEIDNTWRKMLLGKLDLMAKYENPSELKSEISQLYDKEIRDLWETYDDFVIRGLLIGQMETYMEKMKIL